jgi:hypothetical protein
MRSDPASAQRAAFADGRRLRAAAAGRRARHEIHRARIDAHRAHVEAHRARRHVRRMRRLARRRHPVRSTLRLVMILLFISVVASTATVTMFSALAAMIALIMVAGPVLIFGGTAFALASQSRPAATAGTDPRPARPATPRPRAVWESARDRFSALRAEYAAFECDPMQVLHRPALTDVSVGSTARFVDAFAEAQALETDSYPPREHGASFVSAVDKAERAWRAAVEAADRIRLSGLSPAERGTVERVIKLLTTARDSDSDPERHAAYARARSELAKLDRAGVIHLPRTAEAALDASARGALPA